jgi:diacylglycerol kinase family enzyme
MPWGAEFRNPVRYFVALDWRPIHQRPIASRQRRIGFPRIGRQMMQAWLAAILALVLAALTLAAVTYSVIASFPRGLILAALLVGAGTAGWYGLIRRGTPRVFGLSVAATLVLAAVLILIFDGGVAQFVVIGATAFATVAATKAAFAVHVPLPGAADPTRPVLFFNPKSGGGKAERFKLADEARARGIKPIELTPGSDLERLVRDAIAAGADALAMAGGDGSQAVVAAIAAECGLPYACIPSGTRNHFALDLGVDRDDVVGALDAFVDGGERAVDLAEVNGRVFVNNVSLGLYAEAVQAEGYREAKLRTILDTLPDVLGPEGEGLDLRWTGPGGSEHSSGAAILVSNNRYRLGRAVGSGTRPKIDDGLLGITVASGPTRGDGGRLAQRPWREWSAPEFEVRSEGPIAAGIDGEALVLEPPLRFRILPGVLRVRIARKHPGASPSMAMPETLLGTARALLAIAAGRREPS